MKIGIKLFKLNRILETDLLYIFGELLKCYAIQVGLLHPHCFISVAIYLGYICRSPVLMCQIFIYQPLCLGRI